MNRFEKNPLNLSCGGTGTTTSGTRDSTGYSANLIAFGQILVDLRKESNERVLFNLFCTRLTPQIEPTSLGCL